MSDVTAVSLGIKFKMASIPVPVGYRYGMMANRQSIHYPMNHKISQSVG